MKHLFIINPVAAKVKGRVGEISGEIETFFRSMGMDNYHIHVTRWARDGMGYAGRFAHESPEPVRIHAMGGMGTVYEAVNGTIGMPNVQIAAYPMGSGNFFINYFGAGREHLFDSLMNQVFSGVTPIDAICFEDTYGIAYVTIGLEAVIDRFASDLLARTDIPYGLCYLYAILKAIAAKSLICQRYEVNIDGRDFSGEYLSLLIAGVPSYARDMYPAPEAHPNDGLMDIYLIKNMSKPQMLRLAQTYLAGLYEKTGGLIVHEKGRKISVSTEKDIIISIDNEKLYERSVTCEVKPAAIDFVCPDGIDVKTIPRLYKNPDRRERI